MFRRQESDRVHNVCTGPQKMLLRTLVQHTFMNKKDSASDVNKRAINLNIHSKVAEWQDTERPAMRHPSAQAIYMYVTLLGEIALDPWPGNCSS